MGKDVNHLDFVKSFITEMNEQDNRCTATPYFFQIQDIEYVASYHEEEWDRLAARKDEGLYYSETFEGLAVQVMSDYESFNVPEDFDINDDYEAEEALNSNGYDVYREKESTKLTGCFFTETDAKNHLKNNSHHYSSKARTYVSHCFRAPELEQFFKSVGEICGVELRSR